MKTNRRPKKTTDYLFDMNKQNKTRLEKLARTVARQKYPNVPQHALAIQKFDDGSTNALTRCVCDFLNMSDFHAERISNTGTYIDNSKVVTDVLGFKRRIGSGHYIPGQGTAGTSDISAIIRTKKGTVIPWSIEIKYGKDRQSKVQKKYEEKINKVGGVYSVVRDMDMFLEIYDDLMENK